MIIWSLNQLFTAVKEIATDSGMKEENLGEGLANIVFGFGDDNLMTVNNLESNVKSSWFKWSTDEPESSTTHSKEYYKMIHAAKLILAIAELTSCVVKLVYFNTLTTYLKAMEIFVKLDSDREECSSGL
jgi:hypothetical protein